MADRIVVMHDGRVEQIGEPLEVYDQPANLFVAGFIGSPAMNFIHGTVRHDNGSAGIVAADGTSLPLAPGDGAPDGMQIVYGIRPEHLALAGEGDGLPAEVAVVEPTGAEILVVCRLAGTEIQVSFHERHRFKPGQRIALKPALEHVHLFAAAGGARVS